jgi:hypothetical protein
MRRIKGEITFPPRVFLMGLQLKLGHKAPSYNRRFYFVSLVTSVLKSTLFTPISFPLSFLSIPDLRCPSGIRTFRCYKGTAYKLRPSPFKIYLQSPESIIVLPEPNKDTQSNNGIGRYSLDNEGAIE